MNSWQMIIWHWGSKPCASCSKAACSQERHLANELEIPTWHLDRGGRFGRTNPLFWAFEDPGQQRWSPMWATWFATGGAEGIEPPQDIKDLNALFIEWQGTEFGSDEFIRLGQDYFEYFANRSADDWYCRLLAAANCRE